MASFVIDASEAQSMLCGRSMEALLSDLVGTAKNLARPSISGFYVGAVGLGVSGRIFLGVNLEFAGLPLNNSVHAEQFLITNSVQHGEQALSVIAVSSAPCGHCRQFLQELRGAPDLRILIVDAAAETQTLAHLLPHRFGPNDVLPGHFPLILEPHDHGLSSRVGPCLEISTDASCRMSNDLQDHGLSTCNGIAPSELLGRSFVISTACNDEDIDLVNGEAKQAASSLQDGNNYEVMTNFKARLVAAAFEAANSSHAPYTNSPSGVALLTRNGNIFSGSYMESVAHNPSLPPLQAALVAFVARDGGSYNDIVQAVLVEREGAPVQFMETAKLVLQKVSQHCEFHVHYTS